MNPYTIDSVKILADGLDHPECVAVHPNGSVWAGGEAGQIYRITPDGEVEELANTGGFVLGLAFSPHGWLAVCDLKKKCIWKFDPQTHKLEIFTQGIADRTFKTPNFPVFDASGNLYVSDSGEFRKENGCIFKFSVTGLGDIWHPGPFAFANGMALSREQDRLYVVSTWLPGVEAIEILKDGSAGDRTTVIKMPETCPDGIALDEQGNLLISCYAPNTIYKLDSSGKLVTLIQDWESHTICNPTNIAFGGEENKELFIANLGRWHISNIRMEVAGLPLAGQLPYAAK